VCKNLATGGRPTHTHTQGVPPWIYDRKRPTTRRRGSWRPRSPPSPTAAARDRNSRACARESGARPTRGHGHHDTTDPRAPGRSPHHRGGRIQAVAPRAPPPGALAATVRAARPPPRRVPGTGVGSVRPRPRRRETDGCAARHGERHMHALSAGLLGLTLFGCDVRVCLDSGASTPRPAPKLAQPPGGEDSTDRRPASRCLSRSRQVVRRRARWGTSQPWMAVYRSFALPFTFTRRGRAPYRPAPSAARSASQ
jgi:hypothetical protein